MTKRFMQIAVVLLVGVLCLPAVPSADQAQYFYDELGRLVGVVDEFSGIKTVPGTVSGWESARRVRPGIEIG